MSKQAIGFEIWGEDPSNDPSSLHAYVMQKNKAPKAPSNCPSLSGMMADVLCLQNVSSSSQSGEKAACLQKVSWSVAVGSL